MPYILEIYYQGECIEQRKSEQPYVAPNPGERMHVVFQNPHYHEEHGAWWVVRERKFLLFGGESFLQTTMLYCDPDPKGGA